MFKDFQAFHLYISVLLSPFKICNPENRLHYSQNSQPIPQLLNTKFKGAMDFDCALAVKIMYQGTCFINLNEENKISHQ